MCSARGCRRTARWQLRWRNPRLHAEDRRKVWTACDEHRQSLGDFLSARGFLREVVAIDEPAAGAAAADGAPAGGAASEGTTPQEAGGERDTTPPGRSVQR